MIQLYIYVIYTYTHIYMYIYIYIPFQILFPYRLVVSSLRLNQLLCDLRQITQLQPPLF